MSPVLSLFRGTHPAHCFPSRAQAWCAHCPLKQMGLSVGQTFPQLPQFCGSLIVSTQPVPAQYAAPEMQMHCPAEQLIPVGHASQLGPQLH